MKLRDVAQLAHVVDAGVRGGVDLAHVHVDAFGDLAADDALIARLDGRALHAVQRLGENARAGGLAHAADAGEEIRVMNAARLDRILQSADRRLLADDVAESLGAVFARERLIGHKFRIEN